MNNYLLQLLKEVKTLIIPGLGALTVTNESTGEILFMPYLKFDDGTLAKHIASKENMELHDASNMISKFVREVTVELDKGNSYDMYQFGRFVKVDGEIAFEAWQPTSVSIEKPTESPVEQKPAIETPPTPEADPVQQEEKPNVEIPPVIEPKTDLEPSAAEKIIPPVKEEAKKTEEPKIVETPKAEEMKVVTPVVETPKKEEKAPLSKTEASSGKNEIPEESKPAPAKPVAQKEPVKKAGKEPKAPKEKKKTSVFAYILWGFLVLVLGSGTFIAIKFDSLKKDFPILADLAGENDDDAKGSADVKQLEDEPDVNIDSETESEPVPEDQVQIVEDQLPDTKIEKEAKKPAPIVKEKPAPKVTPTPKPKPVVETTKKPVTKPKTQSSGNSGASFDSSKQFHIIAGSFGSEANANKLASKLRNQGFSEASVTKNSGMYRVSVKGFSTLNEATAEAANVQSSVPGAWVLKM